MKKVLILAYDYPPKISIGAQRPLSWYKYFTEFGLFPIVITRNWEDEESKEYNFSVKKNGETSTETSNSGHVIRGFYKLNLRDKLLMKYGANRFNFLRKSLTLFYSITSYFSFSFDSTASIYNIANGYLKNNNVHAIIATGEPFILFRYASKLSSIHNIPWIADYRDCWTTDNLRNESFLARVFNKILFERLEIKYLATTSLITTAAPSYKSKISQLTSKKIDIIFNGFFEEIHKDLPPAKTEIFTISYGGTIYDFQPIELFIEAIKELDNEFKICLNFYGIGKSKEEYLKRIQLNTININIFKKISQDHLINQIKKSDILLLLASPKEERLAAKIFDYLPLNIPILLAIDDNGILNSIISETESGYICQNKNDIQNFIKLVLTRKESETNNISSKNYKKYTRKNQTKILANLITDL